MRFILSFLLCAFTFLYAKSDFQTHLIASSNHQAVLTYQTIKQSKKAILYIHGFNDYFFNEAFAVRFLNQGYSFYAIDLHHYGRSLQTKEKPYYFTNIHEFDDEITQSIDFIKKQGADNITLFGYSQGGLIATLYAHKYKNIDQLILDSAFFEFPISSFLKNYLLPLVAFLGEYFPSLKVESKKPNIFSQTLHKDFTGEWDFDLKLKHTLTNAPIYLGWVHAIYKAQSQLKKGLNLNIPVLSLYSHQSHIEKSNKNLYYSSDLVLKVQDIAFYSNKLNKNPSLTHKVIIKDGMHGVVLSKPRVREKAYQTIFEWLKGQN